MRVHELAKELKIETKELLKIMKDIGLEKKSSLSSVEQSEISDIRSYYKESGKQSKRKKVIFNNSNNDTRSYSTDQKKSYPQIEKTEAQTKKTNTDKLLEKKQSQKSKQESEPKKTEQNDKNEAKEKMDTKPTNETGDKKKKMTKADKKQIIGTVSTTDYSRPMPAGRPSRTRIPQGRPSKAVSTGGSQQNQRKERSNRHNNSKSTDYKSKERGKSFVPSKKESFSPEPVEEVINKNTGAKRFTNKKKKVVQIHDKDKLEKKRNSRRKNRFENQSGEFDFGKKRKQKSGKYKEQSEKVKSEKLDEKLQNEVIYVPEEMTVKSFSELINKNINDIIMKLMESGKMLTINHTLDFEMAALIAMDYNINLEQEIIEEVNHVEAYDLDYADAPDKLVKRAPVVTVMGHVDHGKTSLLDAIRKTGVVDREAGGITQHIGASEVEHQGERILFLDTPGHEAFTSLRARGAKVTDIAILVVAADDGVMPQTIEAIDHSKAAGVPIIVAINKMDKPQANPDRVKQELSERGVIIEEWGGDVIAVPVSAKTGEGLDKLLEMILLVAEVQDYKANPNRPGIGTIVEAKMVKGRGIVATVILEKGTLRVGQEIVAGKTYGRVKALYNHIGKKIKQIGPSTSAEIDGLNDVPLAGERLYVTPDEKTAKTIAEKYALDHREKNLNKNNSIRLEDLFDKIKEGIMKDLNIIIKADVHGSVEAIKNSLLKLTNDEVRVNVIRADIGAISESDVILASASHALIIAFNVRPSVNVSNIATEEGVDIRTYSIIYNAINDVETAMKGMLAPQYREVVLGRAEVRATFKIPNGLIAGSYVTNGKIMRNAKTRVIRDGIVIFDGDISSLKRFKDDAKEVASGYECGIGIERFTDIKEGDELEAYMMEEVARE